jgi:2-(1,2-epoxy-1,2-dihydrophenyl)acetyl-CoA isomerase
VIVRGEGKAFSTGLDLTDVDPQTDIDLGAILERHFEPLIEAVRSADVPVIAAVNGPAAGVSVALALAADLCIASDAAYFLLPFTGLGLVPDGGLTWLLPRLAGAQRAAAVALLGERIGAATAANWGLIWKCVPAAEFDTAVTQCAQRLASLPRAALAATKRALIDAQSRGLDAHLLIEREMQQSLGRTPEFRARLLRFLAR